MLMDWGTGTCSLTFVGALLQLTVVRSLLHKIKQVLRQGLVGDGPRCKAENS